MQNQANSAARVRVLIVEDSPTQALHLRRILEGEGYDVQVTRDGQEALDYLIEIRADAQVWLNHRPALVLSDIEMPRLDGCQLCARVKEDERLREVPVVLLTSMTSSRDALRGLYAGADNLISKPYEPAFLLARVQEIVASQADSEGGSGRLLPVTMDGHKYFVSAERLQTINLILTTYETAVKKNLLLEEAQRALAQQSAQLKEALATIGRQEEELVRLRGV